MTPPLSIDFLQVSTNVEVHAVYHSPPETHKGVATRSFGQMVWWREHVTSYRPHEHPDSVSSGELPLLEDKHLVSFLP